MATEKLKFKIKLFSTYWDKKPICDVLLNGKSFWIGEVSGTEKQPTEIEFEHECEEGKEYKLVLDRQNKDSGQTVVKNGEIEKDQLLLIQSIEIDEIDIGSLVFEGIYRPEYPEPWASQQKNLGNALPETLKNVTSMGHNGTWTLTFTSPFYMWLLENLY
jgi:hypothetical protein